MTVTIRWSGFPEDDLDFENPFTADQTYLATGEWADCEANAESAVNDIAEAWFGDSEWEEQFGAEATSTSVAIQVHAPPSIAGFYLVDLERVTKARSKKIPGGEA